MTLTDICIPYGNEEEYIEIAMRLGTKSLLFLYEPKKERDITKINNKGIKIYTANLILKNTNKQEMNFAKANMQTIENKDITHIYDLESFEENDNHHYRRSGMNQTTAKKIKEQDKTIIINIEKIITNKEPQKLIGRVQQNLELARKYKLKIAIASMATKPENLRPEKEMQALIKTIGHEEIAKRAILEITKQLE